MVEALTVVLAVGVTRGWRSTLLGTGAALIALAAIVAVLGPALTLIPIAVLRLVVGALLLVFGLQWLRKAILRASGYTALRDVPQRQVDWFTLVSARIDGVLTAHRYDRHVAGTAASGRCGRDDGLPPSQQVRRA